MRLLVCFFLAMLPLLATAAPASSAQGDDPIVEQLRVLAPPVPEYPSLSKRLEEQGTVRLYLHLLADGTVGEVRVQRSSGYARLDAAALEASKTLKFTPARTRSGKAADVWAILPVEFRLED